jgi:hypothetical protein
MVSWIACWMSFLL